MDKLANVSIHAPARGATESAQAWIDEQDSFQSTRPRGARLADTRSKFGCITFQSTRPRGARLADIRGRHTMTGAFQSTRPRGARQHALIGIMFNLSVSIHAPARGATSHPALLTSSNVFQSTRPRGARRRVRARSIRLARVSIHAPARGATEALKESFPVTRVFQSTRPRGARLNQRLVSGLP